MSEIFGRIEAVEKIPGVNPKGISYVRYVFHISGKKYSTFNEAIGNQFKEGDFVKVVLEQNGKFMNMKSMDLSVPSKDNGVKNDTFHLSIEECRARALESSIASGNIDNYKTFFEWISNGEDIVLTTKI